MDHLSVKICHYELFCGTLKIIEISLWILVKKNELVKVEPVMNLFRTTLNI